MPQIRRRIIGRVEANRTAMRVLVFLADKPDDWFAADAIQTRTQAGAHLFTRLLDELVDDGFLRRREVGKLALYALTRHREVRDAVFHLAAGGRPSTDALEVRDGP